MLNGKALLLAAGAGACGLALAAATPAITLHINTGLWELTTTSTSTTSGLTLIPEVALAHTPPGGRAQIDAAARGVAQAHTRTSKQCVTQKTLDRPFDPSGENHDMTCKQTVLSSSATAEDVRVECTGTSREDATSTGIFHFEAPSPETMKGHMNLAVMYGAQTTTIKIDVGGKWLGADCGTVAPGHAG